MVDTTKIYENIFIKKNAAGDREYIKVPYAILADPPTIPDVSGFMPKSGGTFTGEVTFNKKINLGQGDANCLYLGSDGRLNGPENRTLFGLVSGATTFGHQAYSLHFRGSAARPQYTTDGSNYKDLALKSDIPAEVTESTVSGWGFTKNKGTVTSVAVKMNGASKGTVTSSGTIDLGTVITSHQDISGKANLSGGNTFSGQQIFQNTNSGAVAECVVNNTAWDSFTVRSVSDNTQKTAISNGYVWCQDNNAIYSQFKATGIYYGNDTSGYEGTLKFPTNISGEKTIATTDQIPDVSGKANLSGNNEFVDGVNTFKEIGGTTQISGSSVWLQAVGVQGSASLVVETGNKNEVFKVEADSDNGIIYINRAISIEGDTGTSGQVLTSQGSGNAPAWTTLPKFSLSGTTLTITL